MKKIPVEKWVRLQYLIGGLTVFLLAPFYFAFIKLMGWRVRDLRRLRAECRRLFDQHDGPWLICANHLTMVDSPIITYAIFSLGSHLKHYRMLPWNLPERMNFQKNIILTVLCYLAKCIPVRRGGSAEEMRRVMDRCGYLMSRRQNLMIFPEGGRSRTGYINVESYSYGVGRFVEAFENCKVLCVYLRGDHQDTYSSMPKRGEHFSARIEVLEINRSEASGLRVQREYAGQIIRQLSKMEGICLASHRQRYCGSERSAEQKKEPGSTFHQPRFQPR